MVQTPFGKISRIKRDMVYDRLKYTIPTIEAYKWALVEVEKSLKEIGS